MKKYLVTIKVMTEEIRQVEAETTEEAEQKAMRGEDTVRTSRVLEQFLIGARQEPDAQ